MIVDDKKAKTVCEPIAAFIAAHIALSEGSGLSGYFLLSSICLYISSQYAARQENAKLQALEDARAEQQWMAENMPK
ncbi:hypothetical protein FRUB_04450 [Fimbriiglobus ruber]|uniref:Uncharacterized protein n=1 Tax=Fimbriiglobus ruber TaxID=1908690 RepID=A0A225DLW5_9BACT|nr:hypothetical protein FRUB_04450 [Fimbriiglobus ruber]